jgi:predicted MFS family arabinose efflux permease
VAVPLRSAPLRHIYAALAAGTVLSYAPSFLAYDQRLAGRPLALACFPSIYNAVWLLSNWPAGVLGDKLGCWKVVVSGYALASLAWLLFPWPRETVHLYLLYSLYCLGNSAGSYAEVLVMKHAPQGEQGRAMGLLDVFRFAGSAIGEGCGGLLWRILGAEASYILTALGMGLACILVLKASQSSKTCALFPDGGDSKSLSRWDVVMPGDLDPLLLQYLFARASTFSLSLSPSKSLTRGTISMRFISSSTSL